MTEHLKELKRIAYLELGIINLIEAIQNVKELTSIKWYLRDLIEGCDNTKEKNPTDWDKFVKSLKEMEEKE